jgi:hypothetical protein
MHFRQGKTVREITRATSLSRTRHRAPPAERRGRDLAIESRNTTTILFTLPHTDESSLSLSRRRANSPDRAASNANAAHRELWNKGKTVGRRAPFELDDVSALRVRQQPETGCASVPSSTWKSTAACAVASSSASKASNWRKIAVDLALMDSRDSNS